MNKQAQWLFDNAKKFDDQYISRKEKNIFCSAETLIRDYLVAKSLMTNTLVTFVVAEGADLKYLQKQFHYSVVTAGLQNKYQQRYKTHLKFKNGSRIYLYSDQIAGMAAMGIKIDLLYVANSALHSLFHESGITSIYSSLSDKGRVIFNFDP